MLQRCVNQVFGLGEGQAHLRALSLCFLNERRVGKVEEILKVFFLPSDDVPSRGQQMPARTVNRAGGTLLHLSEVPNRFPECFHM